MANTGLLVLSNIKQFGSTLKSIEQLVNTLYIQLNVTSIPRTSPLPLWGRLISQLYVDGHQHLGGGVDLRILLRPLRDLTHGQAMTAVATRKPIDLLFADSKHEMDVCNKLKEELCIEDSKVVVLGDEAENDILYNYNLNIRDRNNAQIYSNVVLGGTFDRIHIGHKIFLSQAVLRTGKRLVIGVTTEEMTKTKTLNELILPVEKRIEDLKNFLSEIDPCIQLDIVPISDPFGPTKDDPNMDLIVVSEETYRGGVKINDIRTSKGLKTLDIFTIQMVESTLNTGPKESKISSSNTRIDILGTRLVPPIPRLHLHRRPYRIGLTGGIASGKSRMAEQFKNKGATIMDCDKIAHEIYEPGKICYEQIIQTFGRKIVGDNGQIDRAKLGAIVFSNPKLLEKLNKIIWPELLVEVENRINRIRPTPQVVVIEAAVLLKAGWEENCHEVWSMIVPPEEAVRRLMERNKLSNTEAWKRISNQMTNLEIVRKSNVVFSSEWDEEFTNQQADKAWNMLMQELSNNNSNERPDQQ